MASANALSYQSWYTYASNMNRADNACNKSGNEQEVAKSQY